MTKMFNKIIAVTVSVVLILDGSVFASGTQYEKNAGVSCLSSNTEMDDRETTGGIKELSRIANRVPRGALKTTMDFVVRARRSSKKSVAVAAAALAGVKITKRDVKKAVPIAVIMAIATSAMATFASGMFVYISNPMTVQFSKLVPVTDMFLRDEVISKVSAQMQGVDTLYLGVFSIMAVVAVLGFVVVQLLSVYDGIMLAKRLAREGEEYGIPVRVQYRPNLARAFAAAGVAAVMTPAAASTPMNVSDEAEVNPTEQGVEKPNDAAEVVDERIATSTVPLEKFPAVDVQSIELPAETMHPDGLAPLTLEEEIADAKRVLENSSDVPEAVAFVRENPEYRGARYDYDPDGIIPSERLNVNTTPREDLMDLFRAHVSDDDLLDIIGECIGEELSRTTYLSEDDFVGTVLNYVDESDREMTSLLLDRVCKDLDFTLTRVRTSLKAEADYERVSKPEEEGNIVRAKTVTVGDGVTTKIDYTPTEQELSGEEETSNDGGMMTELGEESETELPDLDMPQVNVRLDLPAPSMVAYANKLAAPVVTPQDAVPTVIEERRIFAFGLSLSEFFGALIMEFRTDMSRIMSSAAGLLCFVRVTPRRIVVAGVTVFLGVLLSCHMPSEQPLQAAPATSIRTGVNKMSVPIIETKARSIRRCRNEAERYAEELGVPGLEREKFVKFYRLLSIENRVMERKLGELLGQDFTEETVRMVAGAMNEARSLVEETGAEIDEEAVCLAAMKILSEDLRSERLWASSGLHSNDDLKNIVGTIQEERRRFTRAELECV